MKRKQFIPVFIFLLSMLTLTAYAEPTKRRMLNEFSGLYMQRFMKYQFDNGYNYEIRVRDPGEPISFGELLIVRDAAGSLLIHSDDLTINRLVMDFQSLSDESSRERDFCSCMMAFSVLEYDDMDDYFLSLGSTINGGASNAIDKTFEVWEKEMPFSNNQSFWDAAYGASDAILIYSGNYDYYVKYNSADMNGEETEFFSFIAEEHE